MKRISLLIVAICSALIISAVADQAPAPPVKAQKLCSFNKLLPVPESKDQTYQLLNIQPPGAYKTTDFSVKWKEEKFKHHKFFTWIRSQAKYEKNFPKMGCQLATKEDFGRICNYQKSKVDQYFSGAFGKDLVFKCKVPKNHYALALRFVVQLSDFNTSAGGRWSVFSGLHSFKTIEQANKTITVQGLKISSEIKSTKLNTFDVNNNLNIIPEYTAGTLQWQYNKNKESPFVKGAQKNVTYNLTDLGYLKVLPAETEFIIGSIYLGNNQIKQICDNYIFNDKTDDCGFVLNPNTPEADKNKGVAAKK